MCTYYFVLLYMGECLDLRVVTGWCLKVLMFVISFIHVLYTHDLLEVSLLQPLKYNDNALL